MFSYQPPLKDMQFVLSDLLDASTVLSAYPALADVDNDLIEQVIQEAARFSSEILFPLNASGDREGCHYESGVVKTPAGFADAYRQFCDAGWPALACSPDYGGQGLPHTLDCVLYEMLSSANHGWTMAPGLLHGAYACLHQHASAQLKELYLPKIVSGQWLATMCLTEPHAGSDLGLLRTRAIPQDDGSVRITGNKIFISGGEHDLTENIVHLVLARLPDAPAGSRGVSLFLVPKFLPEGNRPGQRNWLECTGIEHKMGIHGSPTCSMQFDQAVGWLIGEPHRGLAAMFVMMNAARLHVGTQGVAIAETAYQNALAYAQERVQLKAANRPASRKDEPADPIIMHPAVQRLLMTQRAYVQGGRMLSYWAATLLDGAHYHPDAGQRQAMHDQLAFITPVVKSMMTDQGFLGASQALQVFGGHGFIRETGIEQYLRDSRVTMLYEGTNEIQAIDLLIRKIMADNGGQLERFLAQVEKTATQGPADLYASQGQVLLDLVQRIRAIAHSIISAAATRPELPYQVAAEVLRVIGHCSLAWFWLQAARVAAAKEKHDPVFYHAKQDTARYYFTFVLPEIEQHLRVIENCLQQSDDAPHDLLSYDLMTDYARHFAN